MYVRVENGDIKTDEVMTAAEWLVFYDYWHTRDSGGCFNISHDRIIDSGLHPLLSNIAR